MKRLILFDIDGTLLWARGAPKRAFSRAMLEVYGTTGPIATHSFSGKTDPQIARELLALDRIDDERIDGGFSTLWDVYLRELRVELARPDHVTIVLPGVRELVDALERQREDVLVGLLTGNIEGGASLKLSSAGLPAFRLGAFGSDCERRDGLPPVAVERARALTGKDFRGRDIVVIGDTPNDVTCGAALGVHPVGVTTGNFDRDALVAAGAGVVFDDLSDTAAVLEALLG